MSRPASRRADAGPTGPTSRISPPEAAPILAEPALVACYFAAHAESLSVATLVRRVGTISRAHEAKGLPNPCRSVLVRATLQGIKRKLGVAQRQAKPLLREDLFRVLDALGESMKGARDRALLLIGFAGGFRRSEIVGLDCSDVERVRQGLIVTPRRSKTDEEGAGRKVDHPFGRTAIAPSWPSKAGLSSPGSKLDPSSGQSAGMAASVPYGCLFRENPAALL